MHFYAYMFIKKNITRLKSSKKNKNGNNIKMKKKIQLYFIIMYNISLWLLKYVESIT